MVKNNGQIPQYYVENNHPAIIERDMWELVQIELARRSEIGTQYSSSDEFASKLICEDCGGFYGKKKWHSNSKYSRFIYQCNHKFHKHKDKCHTPNLKAEDIKHKFTEAYNITMEDKERMIEDALEVMELLTDTSKLDKDISKVNDELILNAERVNLLIKENSKTNINLEEYNKKYQELTEKHDRLQKKQEELLKAKSLKENQAIKIKAFINNLSQSDDKLDEWNEHVWMTLVERAVVHRDSSITFKLNNGEEVTV